MNVQNFRYIFIFKSKQPIVYWIYILRRVADFVGGQYTGQNRPQTLKQMGNNEKNTH